MRVSFEEYQKKKLLSSYFSVILSIFLVLFLLGSLGLFLVSSKKLSDNFKEKIPISVYFKNEANDSVVKSFGSFLKQAPFVSESVFTSKEIAAERHKKMIGEDFINFIGSNPLEDSYDFNLKADYVIVDSIVKIQKELLKNIAISDIVYDKNLVDLVNDNVKNVTLFMLIISGFFLIIATLLINSAMRLSVYSNRFIIKTMQVVGATKSFIRRPFIWKSVKLGIIGSLLAVMSLVGLLYYIDNKFPKIGILSNIPAIVGVLFSIFIIGILITFISTFFATQHLLNYKTDELY